MIRFLPDTLREALMRPIAVASPDAGVYVEIIAPDFRFAFAIVLLLAWLLFARGPARRSSPVLLLCLFIALAFVPWLQTTGNGRYFMAFLLLAGPLCVGLSHLLPATRPLRLTFAAGMVAWQAFLVWQISPWHTWGHVTWRDGTPFGVEVPADVAAVPATFVTLSSISYSLIAPRFHPDSRWINISTLTGANDRSPDGVRAKALLDAARSLQIIFPTVPGGQLPGGIDPGLGSAIDELLARQELSLGELQACRLLPSAGLAAMASSQQAAAGSEPGAPPMVHGFWLCPLQHGASAAARARGAVPERIENAFRKLEQTCPRIFPPGDAVSLKIPAGAVRGYPTSDFKAYVLENGDVWYKYFRALNPVRVGSIDDLMRPDFRMDCEHVKGRAGLPWERGI